MSTQGPESENLNIVVIRKIERDNDAEVFASIPSTKGEVSWSTVSLKVPSYPQHSAAVFEGLHQQHNSSLNSKTVLVSHRFQFLFFIPL